MRLFNIKKEDDFMSEPKRTSLYNAHENAAEGLLILPGGHCRYSMKA